jgi:phosphotriesterase-related protein
MKRVANATGLHVIAGSGWYHQDLYPSDIAERSAESLTDEIVRDISSGIGDTGVRKVLALIQAEGADPKRVVLGCSDTLVRDPGTLKGLLELGAYVQFDGLGEYSPLLRRPVTDHHVAQAIVELITAGFGDRLLLSQGVDSKIALRAFGGRGYTYVVEVFAPHLRELGVTQAQIDTMIEANPQRVLALAPARIGR